MTQASITRPEPRLTSLSHGGGLLVSGAPAAVEAVLAVFSDHGLDPACVIGEVGAGSAPATLTVV